MPMRRRWYLFKPFDLIARLWPVWTPRRGLLIVHPNGLGDMILLSPFIERYARVFGLERSEITLLGCSKWQPLAARIFAGCRVIGIDKLAYTRNVGYRFKTNVMVRRLAPASAVCAIFMRRNLEADSLVWITGAPDRILTRPHTGPRQADEQAWYLKRATRVIDHGPDTVHELVRHNRFLDTLEGRERPLPPIRLDWPKHPSVSFDFQDRPYVVLHPVGDSFVQRWPMDRYVALARRIRDRLGLKVVFMGKKGGAPLNRPVPAELGLVDLIDATSLPDAVDLLKGAALVVSNDSGPAHMAIFLGTPLVVVKGGRHFQMYFPYPLGVTRAPISVVYEEMPCFGCFWGCRHADPDPWKPFPCITAITLDRVWEAVERLMR